MLFGFFDTCLAVVLELLVIYYLARGPRKRFPFVLVFCVVQVLVVSTDTLFSPLIGVRTSAYVLIYWAGDMIAHAAIVLLTISLVGQTLEQRPERRKAIVLLGVAVVCFALFSAYIFHEANISRWMTSVSRNLSFCEEMLNLILWTLLIQRRDSDYLLLMVSAGIGVQVTGEAIGHTLRLYTRSHSAVWVPNLLVYVAEILCLCIWIWAFRSARNKQIRLGQPLKTDSSGLAT
jgi:hypothetical protein